MRIPATEENPSLCHCGALRAAGKPRCRKCHYRARWYRRKAWRRNPVTPTFPATAESTDLT